jgi:hypothetical protein
MKMREKLPRIESLTVEEGLSLALKFADGWSATVDLSRFIGDFPSLTALGDPVLFAKATIEEWGSGVTWDDEGPLSIAATTLYRIAAEQSGDEAKCFDAWMARHGFSASKAADALGMTRRSIISYRTGSRPIPKVVGLACKGWEVEHLR